MKQQHQNRGGRPPKNVAKKQDYCISFFVDFQTWFLLETAVRNSGLSRSEYLRQLVKNGKIIARCTPEELTLYRQIAGLANNLNMLARRANIYGLPNVQTELTIINTQLSNLLKQWSEK